MLDFCGAHNVTANFEVIPIQKVNEAYDESIPFLVEIPKRPRSWSYATWVFSVVSARRISVWSAVRSSDRCR